MNETIKFFEVEIGKEVDDCESFWMCMKGKRQPTILEANDFLKADCKMYDGTVQGLFEIPEDYARDCYNFENEKNWPVFQ